MGERMAFGFTLQARNSSGSVTKNYVSGSYAMLDPADIVQLGLGAMNGAANLASRLDRSGGSAGSFAVGEAAVTASPAIMRASPDDPDGPLTAKIGIALSDSDGVTLRTADMNMDVDGAGGNDHVQIGTDVQIRFGRLRLENAVGSEKLQLPLQMETQYWTGPATGFARNTDDSCTRVVRANFTLDPYTANLNACETIVNPATVTLAGGVATINLSAPGAGNDGTVLVTLNLGVASGNRCDSVGGPGPAATSAAMSYLLGRSNDSASAESPDDPNTRYDDNPSSRAAFGLYGGQPNNFIYFRENY
jgi:hypothetical protein